MHKASPSCKHWSQISIWEEMVAEDHHRNSCWGAGTGRTFRDRKKPQGELFTGAITPVNASIAPVNSSFSRLRLRALFRCDRRPGQSAGGASLPRYDAPRFGSLKATDRTCPGMGRPDFIAFGYEGWDGEMPRAPRERL